MARISKFDNANSLRAASYIDAFAKITLSANDIESFQYRYGISNQELSRLTGHAEAQISTWSNGKTAIPQRAQQHLALLFAEFAKHFGE